MELRAEFFTGDGRRAQGQEVVFPILAMGDGPLDTICLGTGFFVSNSGIFATAAHLFLDVTGSDGALNAGLAICQFTPPNNFTMRRIIQLSRHTVADVAVGAVESLFDEQSGKLVTNKMLPMTVRIPKIGDEISTWAYPNGHARRTSNQTAISLFPKLYTGVVKMEHREGRDSVLLPGPCYETDMCIEAGTSGGPVMNEHGHVFAINSSSFEGIPTTYVSHIQSIGGLPLRDCQIEGGERLATITIGALIKGGQIPLS